MKTGSRLLYIGFFYLSLLLPNSGITQVPTWLQKGNDIDGEATKDQAGRSVSMNANGTVVAVGAPLNDNPNGTDAGHTRVYEWNGNAWQQKGSNINGKTAGDEAGTAVSLSSDGNLLAIGAPYNDDTDTNAGQVRVYEWIGNAWKQKGLDINGVSIYDHFGIAVSLSKDGSTLAVGAPKNKQNGINAGQVKIYEWDGTQWQQRGQDINGEGAGDEAGTSVSLNLNGNIIAIGSPFNSGNGSLAGHTRVFEWNGTSWVQKGNDIEGERPGDYAGYDVQLDTSGNTIIIGSPFNNNSTGQADIFEWNGNNWVPKGNEINGDTLSNYLGLSVSINASGNIIAVGAPYNDNSSINAGQTKIFRWNGTFWRQMGSDIYGEASLDYSSISVSLSFDGNSIAIGADFNDGNGTDAGHARIFTFNSMSSIPDPHFPTHLSLYPNPTKNTATLHLGDTYPEITLTVKDLMGKPVFSSRSPLTQSIPIDLRKVTAGLYILEVRADNKYSATLKLIKN